ncbi:MAG: trypsin-like peptidase domain-containing protein [Spirochaetales bacterium]|jgi:S1-C subfamily serine protease|nr:trypsin-like peptidase domain-containing protein [Spirochaetales bacterium]
MRLYSRAQVLLIILVVLVSGFTLAYLVGFFRTPETETPGGETSAAPPEEYLLQTDSPAERMIPVSSGDYAPGNDEALNIAVYRNTNEAVVNITTETLAFNWFLEPVPSEGGSGSGSIIDVRGYILTNDHVVRDAYRVYVTLYDGAQYPGEVIGKDRENDLAVVKFDPGEKALHTISLGTSSLLQVGQKVLAIGNPFGYDRTLTVGVISGMGRPVRTQDNLIINDMIQTDASINPGNSGGPLLNTRGEMIGINTMIYSPSGGSVGIGFAVPVDTARRVVPELIDHGMVIRGWIDIEPVQLDANIVRHARLPVSAGLLVSRVTPGGRAEKGGIRGGNLQSPVRYGRNTFYLGGDIITAINDRRVASLSDLFSVLQNSRPGDKAQVRLVRTGSLGGRAQELTLEVELAERPEGSGF